jgi:hypothetical protein
MNVFTPGEKKVDLGQYVLVCICEGMIMAPAKVPISNPWNLGTMITTRQKGITIVVERILLVKGVRSSLWVIQGPVSSQRPLKVDREAAGRALCPQHSQKFARGSHRAEHSERGSTAGFEDGSGAICQGMWAPSRSWKRQGNEFFPRASRQAHSSAHTLILVL